MENLKQTVLVLSAAVYVIKNDKTGEVENEGLTVRYITCEALEPCENAEKLLKGYKLAKANMLVSDYAKFSVVPAIYSVDFSVNVDSQGKTSLKATNFRFLSAVTVNKANTKLNLNTSKET